MPLRADFFPADETVCPPAEYYSVQGGDERMQKRTPEERGQTLERLMEEYGDRVMRTCLLFLQDRLLAEDASQETFIRAWRALDQLREGATEKAWLMKIAVNVCKSMLRSRSRRIPDAKAAADEMPEPGAPDRYPDHTVFDAVSALPVRYRSPVILCYYQGLSAGEIAGILHLPGATVRTRLARARALLRDELEGWYFDEE